MTERISFVIPCYRSAKTLPVVVSGIVRTMTHYHEDGINGCEILLVCDGSPDHTWETIVQLSKRYPQVKGILLPRNFGQHAAVMAGLSLATGDVTVCLDDDLQTSPSASVPLIKKLNEGYDVVYASYPEKCHSMFRNLGSVVNGCMQSILYGKPKGLRTSSFFAMRRPIRKRILCFRHAYPYLSGMILRSTDRIANVRVKHRERQEGKSNYTAAGLARLLFCGMVTRFAAPGKEGRKPQYVIADRTRPNSPGC